jgi:hypothetical protein
MDEYKKNSKKQLIQIGQQLRKISSIYRIKNKTHSKLWLTGNKDLNHSKSMLDRELSFYKMDNKRLNKVEMKYTKTFREYDNYLSKNIVFIDLFDAAANNSILECIIRNTPVIVNKIPGVVFYLGENYPLYFSNLQEVDEILKNEELILKAHEYLKNMDKTELTIEYFKNDLVTEISNTIDLQKSKKLNMSEKEEFRYICSKYMNSMKKVPLPDFDKNSMYESVLIEYRILPHLEFLIRNTILKLGEKWSHSVVCGNNNYEYMVQLCEKISPNINVIKTNYDNLFPSDYSRFLSSNEFWSLLNGEKILIYQEDSLIFKSDITIDEFMKWDYIGAPWTIYNNDNKAGVGNGGISLRSKSVMMKIMDTISIFDTKYNSSTTEYMNNTKSNVPPEDVYFSKNIEDLNIGSLADRKSAGRFSTESIYSKDCFAGHNFWLRDQNWRDRIHDLMSGLF